jgi:hypothetical protein
MHAALEEAQRADQKKREAAEALQARRHEYETADLPTFGGGKSR